MFDEMSSSLNHDAVDKQVEDLRERMRLLQQDRKASIDLLESRKASNENEIQSLKDENKELRIRLTNLQKSAALGHDARSGDLEKMRKVVLQKRGEYDAQKAANEKLSIALGKLKDEAKMCSLEEKRPSVEDGPLSRKIRLLENRLDKAMIEYNEAHAIGSTYNHIVKRLKEERVSFDNQLKALERTFESKQQNHEELLLLSGDAAHAREVALQNLQNAKCSFEDNKSRRAREIRERQQQIRIRKQMIEKQEKSDAERRKALAAGNGSDSGNKSASNDSITHPVPIGGRNAIKKVIEEQEETLTAYESSFRKIKDATGVSNVDDVIRKILAQESTKENLLSQIGQNQIKIEDLTKLEQSMEQSAEKMKYNSMSGFSKNAKEIDEHNEMLRSRSSNLERTKSQFEHSEQLMVAIKSGVNHLCDKIDSLPQEFGVGNVILDGDTLPEILRKAGDILVDVNSKSKEEELKMNLMIQDSKFTELERSASRGGDVRTGLKSSVEESKDLRPFNQRISLPSAKEITAFDPHESDEEAGYGDADGEEEISRDGVKKASSNIIATEERRKLRSRKVEDD